jgi:hypothetical protein
MYKNEHLQPKGTSVVYWIHRPHHKDITKEGYVGITHKMARDRWGGHKSASKRMQDKNCKIINSAIRKYSDLIYEVVLVADTREYCEHIEGLLRPTNRIGWNIARGGMPVDTMMGGIANKERWLKYWKDNPEQAADKWWNAEQILLRTQLREKKKQSALPAHTKSRKTSASNSSGLTGVTWFYKYNKWHAQLGFASKPFHLGYFDTKEDAHEAYLKGLAIRTAYREGKYNVELALKMLQACRAARNKNI